MKPSGVVVLALLGVSIISAGWAAERQKGFRAGAFAIDITPTNFPVIVNAMFEERSATNAHNPLHSRSLALDDGSERLVITVVDTCMLPRDLVDKAKRLASNKTRLSMDRMLISATHTHSAPSAMGCLGSRVDAQYALYLPERIAEGIERAVKNLAPARVGWGVADDYEHTHCRRWIRRPDRMLTDPFGNKTVRANMHPGYLNPDAIGPSGPVDPALSLLSVQTPDGKPVAVLANYSMHYYESPLLSSDYYGLFATKIAQLIGAEGGNAPFVGIMSQGTSGDQAWMDYGKPPKHIGLDAYAQEVAEVAAQVYRRIGYHDWAPLGMKEAKFTLGFRVPDESRLAWAKGVVSTMKDVVPRGQGEIYAKEAIYLRDRPTAELVLQAIQIGELGLTAIPNEVFALTGLKIKQQSPFPMTFNIELANGAEGYIPPPEQHAMGGYTTWPARTAGLEVKAEPRIVEESLHLLEQVSGKARRKVVEVQGAYVKAILAAKPVCYWRLNELEGPDAKDATGSSHEGVYEGAVAFYLEGPQSRAFSIDQTNRAPHFAGGRLNSRENISGGAYSLELWFWNGLTVDARDVAGNLFSLGPRRDRLFIGGASGLTGRLGFTVGRNGKEALQGKSVLRTKRWYHLVCVRKGKEVIVYLNGQVDLAGEMALGEVNENDALIVAGAQENQSNFEGKLDEVARYDVALTADEAAKHFKISGLASDTLAGKGALAEPNGPYAEAVLALKPAAYWRLGEKGAGEVLAEDASRQGNRGMFEENIELFQQGPQAESFSLGATNHAPQFAGGRLKARIPDLGPTYSVSLWFWNEMPNHARPVTGYIFSRGPDGADGAPGDHLGLGGTHEHYEGRLLFFNGNKLNEALSGRTVIEPHSWNNAVLVRDGRKVTVYLNGQTRAEISGEAGTAMAAGVGQIFVGGRNDNFANFQGRLDEVAVFNRALTASEAASLYKSSGFPAKPLAKLPTPPKLSSPVRTPAESQAMMQVRAGFEVELVASEPLIISPVAIDWGADGKLWVVEMADYPMGMDGKMKPGGRVRVLEDTKGDGHFNKSTLFLDALNFPNGLITWRKGVIVTAAPDIVYAEDTDGDGEADERKVLYTGFNEGNLQLRVNGLRWGLDNWLHCANGLSGGRARSPKIGITMNLSGHDLRLKADSELIELESGQSEFGRNCTDWGDWFGCDNSYPLFHFVLEDRYLRRNPHVAAPESKRQVYLPANPKVYPLSAGQKRYHSFEHAGHFTSACSTDFYRDELLFPRGDGEHAFTCEPVHNLVQHLVVTGEDVSFKARRAEAEGEPEFLASSDQWFRPVMARMGPDGAVWVVDMYRYMIEHPDWLPPEGRKELEPFYRQGEDRGRIYRIFPKGAARLASATWRLDKLSTDELVAALESPNGWRRDKAQQILLWRGDRSAVVPLERLIDRSPNPLARLHALCALDGLGELRAAFVAKALTDSHPAVRRHGLRLAEGLARMSPELIPAAAKLVDDPDLKVRLQLACSLGEWNDERAGQALARLAIANAGNSYITAAVMSSAMNHVQPLANAVAKSVGTAPETLGEPLLNLSFALNKRELIEQMLQPILTPENGEFTAAQMETFRRFLDMLSRRKTSLPELTMASDDGLKRQLAHSGEMVAAARRIAVMTVRPSSDRAAAIALLGRDRARLQEDLEMLNSLLQPASPGEVQIAAVKALASTGELSLPELLVKNWPAHPPQIRSAILDELLGRQSWALALLDQIEHGKVAAVDVDAPHRGRLLKHQSEEVSTRAAKVLASVANPDRERAIESFRPALELTGEAGRGKAVFARLCSTCHRLDDVGRDLGPNLMSVKAHSAEKLLASVLDPSREVEPRYLAYSCALNNGEELYGLIASETGNGIVMKLSDGNSRNILRNEIKSIQATRLSLMPDGLEAGMTKQDMADLIRYLRAQPGVD